MRICNLLIYYSLAWLDTALKKKGDKSQNTPKKCQVMYQILSIQISVPQNELMYQELAYHKLTLGVVSTFPDIKIVFLNLHKNEQSI